MIATSCGGGGVFLTVAKYLAMGWRDLFFLSGGWLASVFIFTHGHLARHLAPCLLLSPTMTAVLVRV